MEKFTSKHLQFLIFALVTCVFAQSVYSHHSRANFQLDETVELAGEITEPVITAFRLVPMKMVC